MKHPIPSGANMCSESANCESDVRKMCTFKVGLTTQSATSLNESRTSMVAAVHARNEELDISATELKTKMNDPEFSIIIDALRERTETRVRELLPDTEYAVICEGPKQRRLLGPICTAHVVEVAKRTF